jgi:hypothetical protein
MSVRIPPSRQLAKQVTGITHKTNKTDDLKAIYDVRCVRTVRLGSPNTALLPYKMEGILQSLLAVLGIGHDPQRREMGNASPADYVFIQSAVAVNRHRQEDSPVAARQRRLPATKSILVNMQVHSASGKQSRRKRAWTTLQTRLVEEGNFRYVSATLLSRKPCF